MGCVTDPNMVGLFGGGNITLCNPVVLARSEGESARLRFTVQAAPTNDFSGGSDTIAGVLTEVNSAGVPHVVDLLSPVHVASESSGVIGPGPAVPYTISSEHALATSLAGKDIHASIGPQNYFKYQIGDVFVPNLNVMLRTDFVVTRPVGSPAFSLAISSLAGTATAGTRPSAGILVQNTGTAAGPDTVTGVLMSPQGVQVAAFSSASTGSIAAGGSRTVTVTLESPIPSTYAGKTLTATFADGHGNVAHASLTVTSSSSGTGTGTGTGAGPSPTTIPSSAPPKSTTAIASTPLLIALAAGVVGVGAIWLGSRE